MTIADAYRKIINTLKSDERRQEATEILSRLTGYEKGNLVLNFGKEFTKENLLENILKRRLKDEPLAYILNVRPFYGYDFYVDRRCLIPRYDSECLVEYAVSLVRERGYKKILDLCCGSGCLGISVIKSLRELFNFNGEAEFSDISDGAMEVCLKNAQALLDGKPKNYIGNLFIPAGEAYDLIICNPPYIAVSDKNEIEAQIKDYEPDIALFAEKGGLELYPQIAERAFKRLNKDGALICEIGCSQAAAVKKIFEESGFKNVRAGADLASRDRFICGEK